MKVAITTWEDRISPVFDASQMLMVVEIENGVVTHRHLERFDSAMPARLVDRLREIDVSVLICGAITVLPARVIEAAGIQLIPFIAGNIDDVLASYARDVSTLPAFLMPGCGRCRRRQPQRNGASFMRCAREDEMPQGDGTGPRGQGPGRGKKRAGRKTGGRKGGSSGQGSGQGRRGGGRAGRGGGAGQAGTGANRQDQ